jgi:hypothetical protein
VPCGGGGGGGGAGLRGPDDAGLWCDADAVDLEVLGHFGTGLADAQHLPPAPVHRDAHLEDW